MGFKMIIPHCLIFYTLSISVMNYLSQERDVEFIQTCIAKIYNSKSGSENLHIFAWIILRNETNSKYFEAHNSEVRAIFSRIADKYDFMNQVISFGKANS